MSAEAQHPRMPMSERAKIFTPFDPLKGFREALRQKEREVEAEALDEWGGNDLEAPDASPYGEDAWQADFADAGGAGDAWADATWFGEEETGGR